MKQSNMVYWRESTREAINLLLAVVAGSLLEESLSNPLPLYEVESALAIVVIAVLFAVKKYRKSWLYKSGNVVMTVSTWFIAVIAGNLFTIGYNLVKLYLPIGLPALGLFVFMVVIVIHLSKTTKHDWDEKLKGKS